MNFFYENLPNTVNVKGNEIEIITDFREYIRLLDMLKDPDIDEMQKYTIIQEYFLEDIVVDEDAVLALSSFITMGMRDVLDLEETESEEVGEQKHEKELFSYSFDYAYILSGFLHDYGIDLMEISYMHWWKFRMLFDGLSENTEIKQRIMYRSIDLSTISDKEERKRISRIQRSIQLPATALTDYDIGNAFA